MTDYPYPLENQDPWERLYRQAKERRSEAERTNDPGLYREAAALFEQAECWHAADRMIERAEYYERQRNE